MMSLVPQQALPPIPSMSFTDYELLSSSDLLVNGPPGSGKSALLSVLVGRHLERGGRVITLHDALHPFLGRGAATHVHRGNFETIIDFDSTRWTSLNVRGFDLEADQRCISRVVQFWVEAHLEFSYSSSPLVLVVDETLSWLDARLTQLLGTWFCGKDLLVWCAPAPCDDHRNILLDQLSDTGRQVIFSSQAGTFERDIHRSVVISDRAGERSRQFPFHDVRSGRVRLEAR